MKHLLTRYLLAAVVALSVTAFGVAYATGLNLELTVLVATVLALVLAMTAERMIPFRSDWNRPHGDLATDFTSAVLLVGIVDPLLKYLAPLLVVYVYSKSATPSGFASELPFLAQVLLSILVIEFGSYWSHRLHHQIRPLWWLHAMHHSSQRLYALNNFRFHPLNYTINFAVSVVPVMYFGVSSEALLAYLAITQPILMFQHANVDLRSGILNYVFSTNELHRWPHSSASPEANSNYGKAIVLWDHLFGTFRYADSRNEPSNVGLFSSSSDYPGRSSYIAQLRSMFTPACCGA